MNYRPHFIFAKNSRRKAKPSEARTGKSSLPLEKRSRLQLIAAMGFGNFLESFDFTVYSYFATIIGLVVLKTDDPLLSTYISTILFGLGFLARPAGSLIIGAYADNYGRKAALLLTILLMGAGSGLIAVAPPYAVLGLGAPLLILLGRLLQGFSTGGEIGSAAALLLESASGQKRGLYMAYQFMMQGVSAAFGALFAYVLFTFIPPHSMQVWGWRIPFLFALLIIPAGLYIRSHIGETYGRNLNEELAEKHTGRHKQRPRQGASARTIWQMIWRQYRRQFILSIFMVMPVTLSVYILVLFMPTYLSLLPFNTATGFLAQSGGRFVLTAATGLLMAAGAFAGGLLCDRLPQRKPLALICLALMFVCSFAVYSCVTVFFTGFLAALAAAVILLGIIMAVQALMVAEAFPRSVRVSALAVSIALGATVFGGTAQVIVTKIMMMTNLSPLSPFYYLGPMLLLSLVVFAAFREECYP